MTKIELLDKMLISMKGSGNYADSTIGAYVSVAGSFFSWLVDNPQTRSMSFTKRMEGYLTWRVIDGDISPSTQNVDFNALLYLGRHVLKEEIGQVNALRAKKRSRIPHILNREQIESLFQSLPKEYVLIAKLLYGSGLRINEALRLRIKDVDLSLGKILIHEGKGDKDGIVPIPRVLVDDLNAQVLTASKQWGKDRKQKLNGVYLPNALAKKYKNAATSRDWYWLFPNPSISQDPQSGILRRHHIYDFAVQQAFTEARKKCKLPEFTTPHTLRHCYATHFLQSLLKQGIPERMAEEKLIEYLRHSSRETLKFYLHMAAPDNIIIQSPLDIGNPNHEKTTIKNTQQTPHAPQ